MSNIHKSRVWDGKVYRYNCAIINGLPFLETNPPKSENDNSVRVDGVDYYSDWATYKPLYMVNSNKEYAIVEQCLGIEDRNKTLIYENDKIQKIIKEWFCKTSSEDMEELEHLKKENEIISEKEDGDYIDVIYKGKIDIATMERFPSYWLKNESFGYEGEELEDPEDWIIIGTSHD